MASPVELALRRAVADLDALEVRWALIGGLAISIRSVPRFTKDLDFAIAVADDSEAEGVVNRVRGRGYQPVEVLEQEYVKRLSGVRLERTESDVIVDLLFASSGIENEVVASATRLEVLPGLSAPVATIGHLIAQRRHLPAATKISPTSAHLSRQHPHETLRQPRRPFGLSRSAASTESRTSERTSTS